MAFYEYYTEHKDLIIEKFQKVFQSSRSELSICVNLRNILYAGHTVIVGRSLKILRTSMFWETARKLKSAMTPKRTWTLREYFISRTVVTFHCISRWPSPTPPKAMLDDAKPVAWQCVKGVSVDRDLFFSF